MVPWRDHVRDADWLAAVLLRDPAGDVQEGDELEGEPGVPTGGTHLRGGSRHHPQVS